MDDLTATRLCAEAMGYHTEVSVDLQTSNGKEYLLVWSNGAENRSWNPLHDDAQAMALVKQFGLLVCPWAQGWQAEIEHKYYTTNDDLNAAIVNCVAAMQRAKGQ